MIHQQVQQYYGKTLTTNQDLQTNACCDDGQTPDWLKQALAEIHPEVSAKYYGCGLVCPPLVENLHILDLGSGSGRDCYVLSRLVGERGSVLGVDMTEEQLAIANKHKDWHAEKYGYQGSNVTFVKGYIEKLDALNLADNQFDVIISNCVINLSPDKQAVLAQAYRLLKTGGELYFSDVYADRRMPAALAQDPVLYGECLSGALYWNDFENLAKKVGFADPRLVEDRPLTIGNPKIQQTIAPLQFFSATYRLFKLPNLEPACEDYGQAVIYKGSIPHHEKAFDLDKHHHFETGKVALVCGNTWQMLHDTRFVSHFEFIGNWDTHYGIFDDCGKSLPYDTEVNEASSSAGGCC